MAFLRNSWLAGACLLCLGSSACFGNRTADEDIVVVAKANAEDEDGGVQDASTDASARDDAAVADCSGETDFVAQLLCTAGLGGADPSIIQGLIDGLLGGGMANDCSQQTDPIAALLCTVTGGSGDGINGLIDGLLGGVAGSLLPDGGVPELISNVLIDTVVGVIDSLIQGLLDSFDAALGGFLGGTETTESTSKSRSLRDLTRTQSECDAAEHEDRLTRLICARQAFEALRQ